MGISKKIVADDRITYDDLTTSPFGPLARDTFYTNAPWSEFRLAADTLGTRTTPTATTPQTFNIISAAPEGLQTLFQTGFDGFAAAGFAPGASGTRLDSNIFRVLGLSDLAAPAYGFTSSTGTAANDFARGGEGHAV
jgi:hypothetical protein